MKSCWPPTPLNSWFVERRLAEGDREDVPAPVRALAPSGHHAFLDQVLHAGGEQLGVDAEVLAVGEAGGDGVGDAADPELERRAVGHVRRDGLADHVVFGGEGATLELDQRLAVLDDRVDLRDVQHGVAERSRHELVDLDDQPPSLARRGGRVADGRAEAHVAGAIHRRHDRHEGVERDLLLEQARDLVEVRGNVVDARRVVRRFDELAVGRRQERRTGEDDAEQIAGEQGLRHRPDRVGVVDGERANLAGARSRGERGEQSRRLRHGDPEREASARSDRAHGALGRGQLAAVFGERVHR
jgi:hypothetical protein